VAEPSPGNQEHGRPVRFDKWLPPNTRPTPSHHHPPLHRPVPQVHRPTQWSLQAPCKSPLRSDNRRMGAITPEPSSKAQS
jgi:hypothetical protein